MEQNKKISDSVIKRLSLYNRVLQKMEESAILRVSSAELARELGLTPSQVRKDLACFGQFGRPGVGYNVNQLRTRIQEILGMASTVNVAVVGAGKLGQALMAYPGFKSHGFKIVAAFDVNPDKIGRVINEAMIYSIDELERVISRDSIRIVILTTPAGVAQAITDKLIKSGVKAILNFVPVRLNVPESVKVHYVDLAVELDGLRYFTK